MEKVKTIGGHHFLLIDASPFLNLDSFNKFLVTPCFKNEFNFFSIACRLDKAVDLKAVDFATIQPQIYSVEGFVVSTSMEIVSDERFNELVRSYERKKA